MKIIHTAAIVHSRLQTKEWRKLQIWYKDGKHNECEKHQKKIILETTNGNGTYTPLRLNKLSFGMKKLSAGRSKYEWSENFDLFQTKKEKKLYYNLKFICDKGGFQKRTLSETYTFIRCQLEHLIKFKKTDTYFINILDGDFAFENKEFFDYLRNKKVYKNIQKYMYIGDSFEFSNWFKKLEE
jgi:hypothetical protein